MVFVRWPISSRRDGEKCGCAQSIFFLQAILHLAQLGCVAAMAVFQSILRICHSVGRTEQIQI